MTKLQRVSRRFRLSFQAIYFVTPVALVAFFILMMLVSPLIATSLYSQMQHAPNASKLLIAIALMMTFLPAIPFMIGLKSLIGLFGHYEAGEIFTLQNSQCYRTLARSIFTWVLLGIIGNTLAILVLTMNSGPGKHMLMVKFVGQDFIALIISGVFVLLSWVMLEAHKLADESAKTI